MKTLYKRIKQRREELGLSQEDLAKMMGYKSRSSINKVETGENDIPESKINLFANVLNVNELWLMGYDVPMKKNICLLGQGDINNIERILSTDEETVLSLYENLNDAGKQELLKRAKELTRLEEYQERVI